MTTVVPHRQGPQAASFSMDVEEESKHKKDLVVVGGRRNENPFLRLDDAVQLYILTFNDAHGVWSFAWTNQEHRRRILGATFLFQELFARKWPVRLPRPITTITTTATAAATTTTEEALNYPFYLRLVPDDCPTHIDERLFVPAHCQNLSRRFRPHYYSPSFRLDNNNNNNNTTLQQPQEAEVQQQQQQQLVRVSRILHRGAVGSENHCVRSVAPFPRPTRNRVSLLHQRLRPFCLAHLHKDDKTTDFSPRLIAYYEVTIHDDNEDDHNEDDNHSQSDDCVAVGISDARFKRLMHRHMPGWDLHSFGYHGDDGGLYHRSGQLVRQSFPLFGRGDTVGCGVDYINNGIFFTLNGQFLGYAWTHQSVLLDRSWSPTVGIDTHAPVSCNFGLVRPFVFDLSSLLRQSNRTVVLHGGALVRDPLLSPQEHVVQLTLNDGNTKKYSRFDERGIPTHWFDGEPLQQYQRTMAESEFQRQEQLYLHYVGLQEENRLQQEQEQKERRATPTPNTRMEL